MLTAILALTIVIVIGVVGWYIMLATTIIKWQKHEERINTLERITVTKNWNKEL